MFGTWVRLVVVVVELVVSREYVEFLCIATHNYRSTYVAASQAWFVLGSSTIICATPSLAVNVRKELYALHYIYTLDTGV